MQYALITDTHLSHAQCIEYDGRAADSDRRIIHALRYADCDVLIHLGDVAFGNKREWHEAITSICRAKGIKCHLVLGNHDKESLTWCYERGWDWVGDEYWIRRQGHLVVFTHRPIPPESLSPVTVNIHGHLHKTVREGQYIGLHLPDNNYRPYYLDALLKKRQ